MLLQSLSDGERDEEHPNLIRVNAMKAYEIALKKYHGWMLQKLFMVSVHVSTGPPQPGCSLCCPKQGLEMWEAADVLSSISGGPSLRIPAFPKCPANIPKVAPGRLGAPGDPAASWDATGSPGARRHPGATQTGRSCMWDGEDFGFVGSLRFLPLFYRARSTLFRTNQIC